VTPPTVVDTTPSIVITSNYGPPHRRRNQDETREKLPEPDTGSDRGSAKSSPKRSPIYLIAGIDGIISAAVAYSVEGETLTFISLKGERRQIPLARVDRSFTQQLNEERGVSFSLP
jgi:hypothetical protein